jgi:NAD(P)-dependent dehydrogenase (short-subunit alcohol dehydrogenase family)
VSATTSPYPHPRSTRGLCLWQNHRMGTALVTGGNRGIGLALVRRLAARGDRVIAVCRQASAELKALEGKVQVEAGVDVTDEEALAALDRRLEGTALDLLVLNAGILRDDDWGSVRLSDVRTQIEVNAVAPLAVVSALRKTLRRGTKIAVITSRMGSMADNSSGGYYGYRMSKAALNAMAVSLSRDLAPAGMAVAILHPGFVRTEMTGRQGNVDAEEAARMLVERIDALTVETSGTFWHANGQILPW